MSRPANLTARDSLELLESLRATVIDFTQREDALVREINSRRYHLQRAHRDVEHAEDAKVSVRRKSADAITGQEEKGITLVVTEGFGDLAMAERTFELLRGCAGMRASVNGATQIRAGVLRPEIIIPRPGVKFRFTKNLHTVIAMLAFDSRGATFYGAGQQANFDPRAPELTRIIKKLFPNDAVIQSLK